MPVVIFEMKSGRFIVIAIPDLTYDFAFNPTFGTVYIAKSPLFNTKFPKFDASIQLLTSYKPGQFFKPKSKFFLLF